MSLPKSDPPSPAGSPLLLLHPDDNVVVATARLETGAVLTAGDGSITVVESVPAGHKLARCPLQQGDRVIKFGQTIGFASRDIPAGSWIHTHNLHAGSFDREVGSADETSPLPAPLADASFKGYLRGNGTVGIRNYLAVIASVNCSASVCRAVANTFNREALREFANIDGVIALTHKGGCGMQFEGEDHRQLARTLAGYAHHPNVGACVLIGLGCETASLGFLHGQVQSAHPPHTLVMQELGGTSKTIEAAIRHVASLLPRLNDVQRQPRPASELIVGTNCGGSDGYSGITANPALGLASDRLVALGGTSVLAETTEIYGAEHLLTRRAKSKAVAEKLLARIRWWERYVAMFGVQIDNNPSPGNKAGGLTTIYEKSLGAVAKGGSSTLNDVVAYAEPVRERGLVFMDTPGLDPVSVTGLVAGGCHLIAFTTGRGSCFGSKPAPTIKIATHTSMFERMREDMDFNAGVVLEGVPLAEVGDQIFRLILRVASGEKTRSELLNLGDEEFAPWNIGPTL